MTTKALIIVSRRSDQRHEGHRVLRRGRTEAQAVAVCSDPRTDGAHYSVFWTDESNLDNWRWHDNGTLDAVLSEYGVTWKRNAAQAAVSPAAPEPAQMRLQL